MSLCLAWGREERAQGAPLPSEHVLLPLEFAWQRTEREGCWAHDTQMLSTGQKLGQEQGWGVRLQDKGRSQNGTVTLQIHADPSSNLS